MESNDQVTTRFRPKGRVLAALRDMRKLGVARRLGAIDPQLVEQLRAGAGLVEGRANHDYIDDVAVHWRRAGFPMTEGDKRTPYTESLKSNVGIAKITDEHGAILDRYRNTPLHEAMTRWLDAITPFADDLSLTRINVLRAQGRVQEHIDPPDQNMIQCLLSGQTTFVFWTKSDVRAFRMGIGEIWWFNTTWPHWTLNQSDEERLLLHTRGRVRQSWLAASEEAKPNTTPEPGGFETEPTPRSPS